MFVSALKNTTQILCSGFVGLILLTSAAEAENFSIDLPTPRGMANASDTIQTMDGSRCSQSVNGGGAFFDIGVAKTENDTQSFTNGSSGTIYGRLIIPIGKKPKRLDCIRLYELELQRLRSEIEYLSMELE
ncbi:hypothetical protein [uncultured Lentibacter sp.]|uniref:hypothetical protein n=1 Tax=uncultured Lentibacter sp. TaxID=1659309 RepID=UPI00260BAA10|nr:hypothetical protein [uncultured Lentibacter sp.]